MWARYSFLGTDPLMVLSAKDGRDHPPPRQRPSPERLPDGDPLEALRRTARRVPARRGARAAALPGRGRRLPRLRHGPPHGAAAAARRTTTSACPTRCSCCSDTLLVFDNLRHRLLVIANAHVDQRDPASLDRAYDRGRRAHRDDAGQAGAPGPRGRRRSRCRRPGPLLALGEEGFTSTMDEATFSDAVRRAKEYIAAGDAYQIVLVAPARLPARGRSVHGLPGAADDQPVAVPLLPAPGPDDDRRLVARGAGARRGRSGGGAADRRHASARAPPRPRTWRSSRR